MAGIRPARKRDTSLIVLMSIFLVGMLVFFAMWISQRGDLTAAQEKAKQAETRLNAYAGGDGRGDDQLLAAARSANTSVIGFLRGQMETLATQVNPNAARVDVPSLVIELTGARRDALALLPSEADRARLANAPLPEIARSLAESVAALTSDLTAAKAARDALQGDFDKLGKTYEDAQTNLRGLIDELTAKNKATADELATYKQNWDGLLEELKKNSDDISAQLQSEIDRLNANLLTSQTELDRRLVTIEALRQKIEELQQPIADAQSLTGTDAPVAIQADGTVLQVSQDRRRVYISLGRRDRLVLGTRFEVYSAELGINTRDGVGKASIEVIAVNDVTAECRILRLLPTEAIVEGDLISNVVFDRNRTLVFAVLGEFDVDGDGNFDPTELAKVKSWIRQWGGKVNERVERGLFTPIVDETTDFVVVGRAPVQPVEPGVDADDEEREAFRLAKAEFDRFQSLRQAARDLRIPVMRQNEFLSYIGTPVAGMARSQGPVIDPRIQRELDQGN